MTCDNWLPMSRNSNDSVTMPPRSAVSRFPVVILSLLGLIAFLASSAAADQTVSGISAQRAWVRWMPAGLPMAGYLTLHNGSTADMFLTGASSPDFATVELHQSTTGADGTAHMKRVERLAIPAGGHAILQPGDYHLMLMQPRHSIAPGEMVTLQLTFDDGRSLAVEFLVKRADQDA